MRPFLPALRICLLVAVLAVLAGGPANAQLFEPFTQTQIGWQAQLINRSPVPGVDVSGTVTIINETTLRVSNFSYGGNGGGAVEFRLSRLQDDFFYDPDRANQFVPDPAGNLFSGEQLFNGFTDFNGRIDSQTGQQVLSGGSVTVGGENSLRGPGDVFSDPQEGLLPGPISDTANPDFPSAPTFPGDVLFDNVTFDIDLSEIDFPEVGELLFDDSGSTAEADVFDFGGITVWCEPFNIDFGSGQFVSPEELGILMGDFDDDGVVNAADFVILRDQFGRDDVVPFTDGDANGDGVVDESDVELFQQNFSTTPVAGAAPVTIPGDLLADFSPLIAAADLFGFGAGDGVAAAQAVPEPSVSLLALVGVAGGMLLRGRVAG